MVFHQLRIKSIKNITSASVEIEFEIPEDLKSEYEFIAGQYITLEIDGVRRDYSLCTSPLEGRWAVGVKAAPNGHISRYLNEKAKVGDSIRVSTPHGRFGIPSKPNEKRTLLAFAAGSGITPIMSIIKYTLETEEWVNFYLFYSNKTPQDTMFLEEIKELKLKYPDNIHPFLFYTRHEMEDWLFEGRLDAHKFKLILNQLVDINEVDEAMVCGPNEMIEVISNEIFESGIPRQNIHYELFTPLYDGDVLGKIDSDDLKTVEVTVELDGEVSQLTWNTEMNLVDAMLEVGIDAPYSCKGGICSSCMCKLEEGEVEVKENFVLTDSDKEEGVILACCSRPKSKEIRINFDDI